MRKEGRSQAGPKVADRRPNRVTDLTRVTRTLRSFLSLAAPPSLDPFMEAWNLSIVVVRSDR